MLRVKDDRCHWFESDLGGCVGGVVLCSAAAGGQSGSAQTRFSEPRGVGVGLSAVVAILRLTGKGSGRNRDNKCISLLVKEIGFSGSLERRIVSIECRYRRTSALNARQAIRQRHSSQVAKQSNLPSHAGGKSE